MSNVHSHLHRFPAFPAAHSHLYHLLILLFFNPPTSHPPQPIDNPYELDDEKADDASVKTSEGSVMTGTGSSLPATTATGGGSALDETREDQPDDEGEDL